MKFSKKQFIWVAGIIIIIGAIFLFTRTKKVDTTQNTTKVTRGNVVQEVSVTGRVKPASVVDLGFEKIGRIQNVYVKVGDHVSEGRVLAEIDSSSAQAALQEAEARLAELKRGSRPEELAVKETDLAKNQQDLTNAYDGILDIIDDALTKNDDAIHSKTAGIFSGFKTSSYKFTFSVCDTQLANDTAWLRYTTEADLELWRTERNAIPSNPTEKDFTDALAKATKHLELTRTFLDSLNRTLTLDCTMANTTLDLYRANITLARTAITTAITTINTKSQTIASLALLTEKVNSELSLMKAGTAKEIITAQEARVFSAQSDLSKYKIYAPINGAITKVDAITGEFANTTKSLISVISDGSYEIDANVPEADIAKIKRGDNARVTLDAYGSDVLFEGRVTAINPAETIIDNVPTYKVTFHFTKSDPRIKSGMTANIDVSTASRTDVLFIPTRALVVKNNIKLVLVINNDGTITEVPIMVGLRGSDGNIEIVSGVTEGTQISVALK